MDKKSNDKGKKSDPFKKPVDPLLGCPESMPSEGQLGGKKPASKPVVKQTTPADSNSKDPLKK